MVLTSRVLNLLDLLDHPDIKTIFERTDDLENMPQRPFKQESRIAQYKVLDG